MSVVDAMHNLYTEGNKKMIHITLPDGSRKPFDGYPTGLAVAKSISEGLARDCVAMELEGNLVDLNRTIKQDTAVRLITTRDPEALEIMRHSAAHVMAQAVVAETSALYLDMEAVERRLQIAEQSIRAFRQSLQFAEIRYRRGLTSVLDVRQASRVLAGAETLVPQLEQDLGIIQQQLSVLLGRYPETRAPRRQPEDYFKRLAPVPPGLPSDLLMRRPDIRAAEAQLRSLNDLVGVAKAARLPRITLTGEYGWSSEDLNKLLRTENIIWNLTAGLVQPVFDAGRLKAGQRAAEARYEQGAAEYVKAVLDAFADVERALLTRELQLDRREREITFLTEARATQRVAQNRYVKGLVNYLDVLNAQITRYQAEDSLVLVDLTLLRNRVALHRALGGSWAEPEALKIKDDGIFFRF